MDKPERKVRRKRKCVTLRGKRKRMQCPCCLKIMEARKDGGGWRVCGVVEVERK